MAWQLLPLELGSGSGQTCWRRLERWQRAGIFDQLQRVLLAKHHLICGGRGTHLLLNARMRH